MRRLGVLTILAIALAGCGSTTTHAQSSAVVPTTTAIHIYIPVSAQGKPLLTITHTAAGECFTGSFVIPAPEGWRCSRGNEILDPCFTPTPGGHTEVICPASPWAHTAQRLAPVHFTGKGNNGESREPLHDPAWAIELANGAHCLILQGATSVQGNLPYSYQCNDGLALYGNENRETRPWTIFGRHAHTPQLSTEQISAIWF